MKTSIKLYGALALVAVSAVLLYYSVQTVTFPEDFTVSEAATTVTVPSTIDPTGSKDVSDAFNAFIAAQPADTIVRFPAGATYWIENVLIIKDRVNFTLDGNGGKIIQKTNGSSITPYQGYGHLWPRTRGHINVKGGSNVVIRNLTIQGANTQYSGADGLYIESLEGQHMLDINTVNGLEIANVKGYDSYGDFIYLGGGGAWVNNIHIHDSHFERNGRQGIAITGAQNVLIENNYFGDIRRSTIDHEPNGSNGGSKGVTFRNNIFEKGHLTFLSLHGKTGYLEDFTVENNTVKGYSMNLIIDQYAERRHKNIRIVGNKGEAGFGSPLPLMRVHDVDGLVIQNNYQQVSSTRMITGVYVTESCSVTVNGNTFPGAFQETEIIPYFGCSGTPSDTTPPIGAITSPSTGSIVGGITNIVASASDNVAVDYVLFRYARPINNMQTLFKDTTAPYSYAWDTTKYSDGDMQLGALIVDKTGNVTSSPGITVTIDQDATPTPPPPVDTTLPQVNLTSPIQGATVNGGATFRATASDNVGIVGVQFKVDGVNEGAEVREITSAGDYLYNKWNANTVPNGTHTISATARDAANNLKTSSVTITVTGSTYSGTTDTTLPTISLTSPAAGSTVTGTTNLAATAADNVGVVGVTFKVDNVAVGAEDTTSPYSYSWNSALVANGSHVISATARDATGNVKVASATVTVSNTTTTGTTVSVLSYGATPNDSTFDHKAFYDAIQYLNSRGGGTLYVPSGTYLFNRDCLATNQADSSCVPFNGTLYLKNIKNVTIRGDGMNSTILKLNPSMVLSSGADVHMVQLNRSSNIKFENLQFYGSRYGADEKPGGSDDYIPEQMHGIHIWGSSNITIDNVKFYRMKGDGEYSLAESNLTGCPVIEDGLCVSKNITITNSIFEENGRSGIGIERGTRYLTIKGNTFNNISDQSIDAEPSTGGIEERKPQNIVIEGNTINHIYSTYALAFSHVKNVSFKNNTLNNGALFLYKVQDFLVEGNTLNGDKWHMAVDVRENVRNIKILNNTIKDTAPTAGEAALRITDAEVKRSHTFEVRGNTITAPAGKRGIYTRDIDNVTIENNNISGAGGDGILIDLITVAGIERTGFHINSNIISNFINGVRFISRGDSYAGVNIKTNSISSSQTSAVGIDLRSIKPSPSVACLSGNIFGAGIVTPVLPTTTSLTCSTVTDTTPPTISLTSPTAGATVTGTTNLAATAADNVGVVGVTFKVDNVAVGAEDTTSPYSYSWNSALVANGSHVISATARDAAGNVKVASATVTVSNTTTTVDTTPPSVSMTAPANGATIKGEVTVSATATDNKAVVGVQFLVNGGPLGTEDTLTPFSKLWTTTQIADGTYTLSARARDAAGNTTVSAPISVTVDNIVDTVPDTTPPTISLTSPTAGSTVTGQVNLSATATDNKAVVGVQFKVDGTNVGAEDTVSPYTYSWNSALVSNGSHTVTATARDAAGNSKVSTAISITVSNDKTAPTVSLSSPASGATVSATTTISATAQDNVGVVGVTFKVDGVTVSAEDTTSPYSVSWNTKTISNGSHTITATARDAAGNTQVSSRTVTVSNTTQTTDTTNPNISLTSPSSGSTVKGTITVTAAATDNVGVTEVQFRLNGALLGSKDTTSPYSVSWDTTQATEGSNTLTAEAKDAAGNVKLSSAVTVTVDNVQTSTSGGGGGGGGSSSSNDDDDDEDDDVVVVVPPVYVPPSVTAYRVVSTSNLSVRTQPGTAYPLVAVVPTGTQGTVLDGPVYVYGYAWLKVQFDSGVVGWSSRTWLQNVIAAPTYTPTYPAPTVVSTLTDAQKAQILTQILELYKQVAILQAKLAAMQQ